MAQPLCTLTDIEKHYGARRVLGPLSLRVEPGRVLGIRGSNGAGKTTLLNIIAGVSAPDRGSVLRDPALRGAVGLVPQDVALYSTLSGRDNLRFWADVYGLPAKAAKARVDWLLELMQLGKKGRERVENYSGGMKRRLNLAAALVITPRLLLLDEPTVGADDVSMEIILSTVLRLRENGCATVMISHHEEELRRVCDCILSMEAGRIREIETP